MPNDRSCGNPALYDLILLALSIGVGAALGYVVWRLL